MPNYCCNSISIKGEPDRLKAFDKQFRKIHNFYEQYMLDNPEMKKKFFDQLTEQPSLATYRNEECAYIVIEKRGYSFENFAPKETSDDILGWYNFNYKNWGCKWDIDKESMNVNRDDIEGGWIYYYFTTAWCDCKEIVEKMAKQYPDLEFTYNFEEDQEETAGVYTYINGEVSESYDYKDYQDKDFREFKCDYLGQEYLKCEDCGHYIEEEEFEGQCPECDSKNILGIDHQTKLEVK